VLLGIKVHFSSQHNTNHPTFLYQNHVQCYPVFPSHLASGIQLTTYPLKSILDVNDKRLLILINVINPVHIFINSGSPKEYRLKFSGYLVSGLKFIGDPY
jgi:hypothetical protein